MNILQKNYFEKLSTTQLARDLLGKVLVNNEDPHKTSGRIVEAESYLHEDPACHGFIGKTKRNVSIFKEAGTSYVYLIYGMYYCFNVVGNKEDCGEAILIRALEPIDGLDIMKKRILKKRRKNNLDLKDTEVLNGPGKVCMGMNIEKRHDGHKLWKQPLYLIDDGYKLKPDEIVTTTRIGITKAADLPLRFYIKNNKYISKK